MSSTEIKPVIIPREILSLKCAKLPEKLMLAMFAADPAAGYAFRLAHDRCWLVRAQAAPR